MRAYEAVQVGDRWYVSQKDKTPARHIGPLTQEDAVRLANGLNRDPKGRF